MAEEKAGLLELVTVEGKPYLRGEWPLKIVVSQEFLTGLDSRTTRWEHGRLSMWLENTSATYDTESDCDPKGVTVILHRRTFSTVKPVPGDSREPPAANPATPGAILAGTTPLVWTPDQDAARAVKDIEAKMKELAVPPVYPVSPGATRYTADFVLEDPEAAHDMRWATPDTVGPIGIIPTIWRTDGSPLSPMTKALMSARSPASINTWATGASVPPIPTGPIPGSAGQDPTQLASSIVHTPGFLDGVYQRVRAELLQRPNVYFRSDTPNVPGGNPAPSGYGIQQSRSAWTDYLTDVLGYLQTVQQALTAFNEADSRAELPTLVVQDPVAFRGEARLSDLKGFDQSQPKEYAPQVFFSRAAMTAGDLRARARALQMLLDPQATLSEDEQNKRRVDSDITNEVDAIEQKIANEALPDGELPMSATSLRDEAWERWAARQVSLGETDTTVNESLQARREFFKEYADHTAHLLVDDTIALKNIGPGAVTAYIISDVNDPDDGKLQIIEEGPDLSDEDIERAQDDAEAYNLLVPDDGGNVYSGMTVRGNLGGNGQMGGDE